MDAGAGSNEDDITMKLMQIVEVNNILRQVGGSSWPTPLPAACGSGPAQRGAALMLRMSTACVPCLPSKLQGMEKGLPIVSLMENWDFLQARGLDFGCWAAAGWL